MTTIELHEHHSFKVTGIEHLEDGSYAIDFVNDVEIDRHKMVLSKEIALKLLNFMMDED